MFFPKFGLVRGKAALVHFSEIMASQLESLEHDIEVATHSAPRPFPAYASSKGAIDVFRYVAVLLGERGITVNTLAPGATDTDMNADWLRSDEGRNMITAENTIKRVGVPDDIADAASFLASNDSRWVTGQRIEASGGANL